MDKVMGGLLQTGSQQQENAKFDNQIGAAPVVYSSAADVPKLGSGRRRRSHRRTRRRRSNNH
jgi:hypothetical protein